MNLQAWLEMEFFGNSALKWGFALLAFLVTFLLLPIVRGYINALRKKLAGTERARGVETATAIAGRTTRLFMWALAVWVGATLLKLPPLVRDRLETVMLVVFWFQVGVWAMAAATCFLDRRRAHAIEKGSTGSLDLVGFLLRAFIWTLVLLLLLDNLGIEVTPLIAGLGITGIAVALAVQTVLGDLLASLSIAFDKPFVVGDFLVVDKDAGTVENIGVKSTRLRSIDGEQIIISNADLLKARVHNYGRMYQRRVAFTIDVRFETPLEKLREVPALLESIVRAQEQVRFERAHLARHSDFALVFEVVYFVLAADYNLYMNIQQEIYFRIHEEFRRRNIPIAYRDRLPPQEAQQLAQAQP